MAAQRVFITAAEVERRARRGQRTLDLGAAASLTPLARERAQELGMTIRRAQVPRTPPPGYTFPPASEAHARFVEALEALQGALAPAPRLARLAGDVLRAAHQGPCIELPPPRQLAAHGFSWAKRRQLLPQVQILLLWAHRLYGPRAPQRRYDILWGLDALRQALQPGELASQ
jgi:hypothetical protein